MNHPPHEAPAALRVLQALKRGRGIKLTKADVIELLGKQEILKLAEEQAKLANLCLNCLRPCTACLRKNCSDPRVAYPACARPSTPIKGLRDLMGGT